METLIDKIMTNREIEEDYFHFEDVKDKIEELKTILKKKCPFGAFSFDKENSVRLLSPRDILSSIEEVFGNFDKEFKHCDFREENQISQTQRIQEEFKRRLQNSSLRQEEQKVALELLKEVQNE